jgi:hypothetical protein
LCPAPCACTLCDNRTVSSAPHLPVPYSPAITCTYSERLKVLLAVQVQGRLGQLVLPAEVCAVGAGPLAALAALRRHLARLRADNELASEAHVVRGTEACAFQARSQHRLAIARRVQGYFRLEHPAAPLKGVPHISSLVEVEHALPCLHVPGGSALGNRYRVNRERQRVCVTKKIHEFPI